MSFTAPAYFVAMLGFVLELVAATSTSVAQDPSSEPLPEGRLGEVIRIGEEIVGKTTSHPMSKAYVGNALNCSSCHLKNGRHPSAGTFVGTATAYPAWSAREQRVITLEDRVLNCFMRSCNGTRPPLGSEVSVAVTAYITWLSHGHPIAMNPARTIGPNGIKPLSIPSANASVQRGRELYAAQCADCHQENGQGDDENPPVWGDRSFNAGAGLASVDSLAAWLKVAMPLDDAHLTEQEALDIAAFVNSNPRPTFDLKSHLPAVHRIGEYNSQDK